MAEGIVRSALKQGMKVWIVTSERIRMTAAELREALEDVVAEARHEHQSPTGARAQTAAERQAEAAATAPSGEAHRTQAKPGAGGTATDDTNEATTEPAAKAV